MAEESETILANLVRHHAPLLRTTGERDGVGDHSNSERAGRRERVVLDRSTGHGIGDIFKDTTDQWEGLSGTAVLAEGGGRSGDQVFALVRPMEIRLAKKVERGKAEFLKEFLFADYQRMWSSDHISDVLK